MGGRKGHIMKSDDTFEFKSTCVERGTVVSLHLNKVLQARFDKACERIGVPPGRVRGKKKLGKSQQEVIRQMIDHCLVHMGL
jgi:hypothetical protein